MRNPPRLFLPARTAPAGNIDIFYMTPAGKYDRIDLWIRKPLAEQTPQKTKSYIIWGVLGGAFLCLNALISMALYGALALIDVALVGGLTLGMYF